MQSRRSVFSPAWLHRCFQMVIVDDGRRSFDKPSRQYIIVPRWTPSGLHLLLSSARSAWRFLWIYFTTSFTTFYYIWYFRYAFYLLSVGQMFCLIRQPLAVADCPDENEIIQFLWCMMPFCTRCSVQYLKVYINTCISKLEQDSNAHIYGSNSKSLKFWCQLLL